MSRTCFWNKHCCYIYICKTKINLKNLFIIIIIIIINIIVIIFIIIIIENTF